MRKSITIVSLFILSSLLLLPSCSARISDAPAASSAPSVLSSSETVNSTTGFSSAVPISSAVSNIIDAKSAANRVSVNSSASLSPVIQTAATSPRKISKTSVPAVGASSKPRITGQGKPSYPAPSLPDLTGYTALTASADSIAGTPSITPDAKFDPIVNKIIQTQNQVNYKNLSGFFDQYVLDYEEGLLTFDQLKQMFVKKYVVDPQTNKKYAIGGIQEIKFGGIYPRTDDIEKNTAACINGYGRYLCVGHCFDMINSNKQNTLRLSIVAISLIQAN